MKYLLSRLNNTTTWLGIIGLVLLILQFDTALAILFLLMVFCPEKNFSEVFAQWTSEIKNAFENADM